MFSLRSMTLTNFKGYSGTHTIPLDNAPGLYYVNGVNNAAPDLGSGGAGKSTLLDALAWCPYGKTLRDERPGASVEPWNGATPTEVSLTYSVEDMLYVITRGRRPNILQWQSKQGSGLWSVDETCDQTKIDEIFPLSFEAFRCTIVLPQFSRLFLDLRPEEQSRLFSELLGLDKWLTASETAGALARAARDEKAQQDSKLGELNGRLAELEEAIKREDEASSTFAASIKEEVTEKKAERRRLSAELGKRKKLARPLDRDVQKAAGELEKARLFDREAYSAVAAAERATVAIKAVTATIVAQIEFYESRPSQCVACGQKVPASHYAKMLKTTKDSLTEAQEQSKQVWDDLVNARKVLEENKTALDAAREAHAYAQKAHTSVVQTWSAYATETARLAKDVESVRLGIAAVERSKNPHAATIERLEKRYVDGDVERQALVSALEETEWSVNAYTFWSDAYRKIRLQEIDDVLGALEESANTNAELLGLHGWEMKFGTERETASGKVSQSFTCLLYPPGHEAPIKWEAYCGNEVQRWQLAVRFAMSELLLAYAGVETGIEFLDEPTAHLSPAGVTTLLERLQERAIRLNRQIWLVDHHIFGIEAFDGLVTVTHDVDGSSVSFGEA